MKIAFFFLITVLIGCQSAQVIEQSPIEPVEEIIPDDAPRAIYAEYRESLRQADYESFLQFASERQINKFEELLGEKLTERNFKDIATIVDILSPGMEDIIVENELVTSDTALLELSDRGNAANSGVIRLILQEEKWKVDEENWKQATVNS